MIDFAELLKPEKSLGFYMQKCVLIRTVYKPVSALIDAEQGFFVSVLVIKHSVTRAVCVCYLHGQLKCLLCVRVRRRRPVHAGSHCIVYLQRCLEISLPQRKHQDTPSHSYTKQRRSG